MKIFTRAKVETPEQRSFYGPLSYGAFPGSYYVRLDGYRTRLMARKQAITYTNLFGGTVCRDPHARKSWSLIKIFAVFMCYAALFVVASRLFDYIYHH